MKELDNFRRFLNEELNEGLFDEFKKELGDVLNKAKEMAKEMEKGATSGGDGSSRATKDRQLKADAKKAGVDFKEEMKKTQESELHEGTWGLGSPVQIDDIINGLQALIKMADDAQDKKNAAGRGFVDGLKNRLKAEKWNTRLYNIVGDDEFLDAYDAAKVAAEMNAFDRVKNKLGDAIVRATELRDTILKNRALQGRINKIAGVKEDEELKENDSVLDEVIEEGTIFDEIDNNMKLIAVHMSAADALEDIVAEFQAISGGTKLLAQVLRNIVRDNNLTGDPEEYASIGFEESLDEGLTQDILKKHPKKYKDEKAVKAAAAKLMKSPKFKGKGIGPVLQALLKGKE